MNKLIIWTETVVGINPQLLPPNAVVDIRIHPGANRFPGKGNILVTIKAEQGFMVSEKKEVE